MAETVILSKWGLTMEEGTVTGWQKQEGDVVALDDVLADVETDHFFHGPLPSEAALFLKGELPWV